MREIKFRCWHKIHGWCGAFSVHQTGLVRFGDSEPIWQTQEEANVILMQFTGLLDKNGKEIYEGDIVQVINETFMLKAEILFQTGCYKVMNPKPKMPDIPLYFVSNQCEIIGNIYENPELLESPPKP